MQVTLGTQHLSLAEFKAEMARCKHGETVIYAIGDLAGDRHYAKFMQTGAGDALEDVANAAYRMQQYGEACLTQKRIGREPGRFEYRATKKTPLAQRFAEPASGMRSPKTFAGA